MTKHSDLRGPLPFFPKGDVKGLVLFILAEKPKHGYEIMKSIEDRFHGFYRPSPGAVYPALRALRRLRYARMEGGERRKVYRITSKGKSYLRSRRAQMERRYREFEAAIGPDKAALLRDFRRTGQLLFANMRNVTPGQARTLRGLLTELRERMLRVLAE
ncbi:MAG TPA: PadR family transcriptional regulator [Thermoplasmata archaeon]|nr:PadR family transcriptional regulator [Thermoplasmata archaeon]